MNGQDLTDDLFMIKGSPVGTGYPRPYCPWGVRDGYLHSDGNQIGFFENGMFHQGGLSKLV